jgi:hypothetical protein
MRKSRILFLWCFLFATWAGAQTITKLRLEQALDMETVGDPQISPDGSEIVYART